MQYLIGIGGMALILAIAFLFSSNRKAIRLRVVGAAFALQAGLAVMVLGTAWGQGAIQKMSDGVVALLSYANKGTEFLLGTTFYESPFARNFIFGALPVIIFFAALISILYYLGIMQLVIRWVGGAIRMVTGISRVESLSAASNIFVGQSESPLVIRPYLANLTPSQLFLVMTVGMAGVAGTILGLYAATVGTYLLPYLLAASFMSAPGGILMAKIMMPDDPAARDIEPEPVDEGEQGEERPANIIMAAAQGAMTGVKLAVAVGAMVLAFVALVALANGLLGGVGSWFGNPNLQFQTIVGEIFKPVMFMLNVPWNEAGAAGGMFGTKIVLNEVVAFTDLKAVQAGAAPLSPYTVAVVTFALCGFANFSSIAIQMAVTGGLAPNQRPMIAKLGLKALLAGSLSNLMSAALAGFILIATATPAAPPPAPAPVAAPANAAAPAPAPAPANAAAPAPAR
ncbi:MAG TPA: nucleoside transporter C-terminal domain-containing protein [Allosphingosinicella sp.]|jgi:CNT family concentrative nucleoside transporter|nr:nucleoside transporter C-terminal domain-containing protein [Allosphingosinicella sp.]